MINILFVDDDLNFLEGLKRMLRPLRHEWNVSFATSGADALARLEEGTTDVIVTDMKMPGMDGSQLLQTVIEKYPNVIRLILSGYSEKEMIIKTVGTAHQYLSKPCDAETLTATVKRVSSLRSLLTDETLRLTVSRLPNVPSLPVLYTELIDELGRSEPSTKTVGEIVKKDIGMTVKILQMVNSAFFGLRRSISDSKEAVDFLGVDTISSLTLGLGIISQLERQRTGGVLADLWSHSMSVAVMAPNIALGEKREMADDAFTAGLLHDLGKVVLAVNLPEQFQIAEEMVSRDNRLRSETEKEVFGATHSDVGAFLLGLWGLPASVVRAVAFHDDPMQAGDEAFSALTAVHVANAIRNFDTMKVPCDKSPKFDMEYLHSLGLDGKIPVWREKSAEVQASIA
jgi:HD-like signal output (HDOD) protein